MLAMHEAIASPRDRYMQGEGSELGGDQELDQPRPALREQEATRRREVFLIRQVLRVQLERHFHVVELGVVGEARVI
jgi:hypothetical protein